MNPFRFLDNLLGPLDAISVGVGTAKMLAHGQLATDRIAIRRPRQKTGVAILQSEDIETFGDTFDGDWWYYRVAAGDGRRAIRLLDNYGIEAVMASQTGGNARR